MHQTWRAMAYRPLPWASQRPTVIAGQQMGSAVAWTAWCLDAGQTQNI